jgi:hypothetical protein
VVNWTVSLVELFEWNDSRSESNVYKYAIGKGGNELWAYGSGGSLLLRH